MKNFIRIILLLILINVSTLQGICNQLPPTNAEISQKFFGIYENKKYYLKENENKFGIYDEDGNVLLPCIFDKITKPQYKDFILVSKDNKQGLYYKEKEVISPLYENITTKTSMSYSKLYLCSKEDGKIDIKYFEYKDNQMHNLLNDCEKVGLKDGNWIYKNNVFYIPVKKNNYFGLISFDTETLKLSEILPFEYENMKYFFYSPKKKKLSFEYLCVKRNGKYSILNFKDFKPVNNFSYDDIEALKGTHFLKVKNDKKYALYDTSKNINGEFLYDNIILQQEHGIPVIYVIQNEDQKCINKGKVVLHNIKETGKTILLLPVIIPCFLIPPLGFAVCMYIEDTGQFKYNYSFTEY